MHRGPPTEVNAFISPGAAGVLRRLTKDKRVSGEVGVRVPEKQIFEDDWEWGEA